MHIPDSRRDQRAACFAPRAARRPILLDDCVFRGESDSCSNRSRTVFRIISDSVPIDIGRDSGLRPDSFATSPERCPINPGIVSDLVRNAVGFASEWCLI